MLLMAAICKYIAQFKTAELLTLKTVVLMTAINCIITGIIKNVRKHAMHLIINRH